MTWSSISTPAPPDSSDTLLAVSCASVSACTAVGGQQAQSTLAEQWDGTSWTIVPSPSLPPGSHPTQNALLGVSCPAANRCTAVGYGDGARPLIEQWDGAAWSLDEAAAPLAGTTDADLNGVSCATGTTCTAVGVRWAGPSSFTLAELHP